MREPAAVEAFRIDIPESALADLRERLARTRWPDAETVSDWSQGIPLAYTQELCRYWAEEYDWRATEARINAFPQIRTVVDDVGIHALHVRSPEPDAVPLVLTHGWPGSVVEFLDVIGPLTNPVAHGGSAKDAFHVVVPSLPGYGFSDRPRVAGWGIPRIARAFAEVMARLGYDRFGAQGGDWGAMVTTSLAAQFPDRVTGIHTNMPVASLTAEDAALATDDERAALGGIVEHRTWGTGYSTQQSTRPQTLGYGLADSPAAQCAWIVEKFHAWTDSDGRPEELLGRDRMLDNVMLYWLTGTATSSARLYWESFRDTDMSPVTVPSGASVFPREIARLPRHVVERRFTDLRYWNVLDRGGHFAAFEQPEVFVREVRAFFRLVR